MEQPRDEGGPDLAIKAVNDTFILPYFLEEAQRQDLHVPGGPRKNTCFRERRTLRTSTWNSFGGRVTKPQEWPLAAAVERRRGTSAALPIGQGETLSASAKGPIRHAEWLTASLESAVKSSDSLPLFSHLRTLTSRLFSEGESRKMQAQRISKNSIQKLQKGGLPHVESLGVEELVLLARRLAEENSYLETFISSDARVLQSAALVKAQRECAAALESNRRLQRQVEKDRQVIVELELRSRSFADAYAWLTSHNRMIHAKDAPALVALWRKRVAEAAVTKKVPLAPDFTKDLEDAYAVADSEGDVETAAEDGHEKTTKEDLLMAAELREAEAVSEARQAQARAALAEARAAAAEQQLAATKTQLERLTSAAAASAAAAAVAAAASASPSRPAFSDGAGEGQLKGALRESERRAEAAENECTRMKKVLETLQAALDLATSERQRLEQELAEAVTAAEAKLTAQAEQHAAELAEMEAQHSQTLESMRSSVHETAKLRQELDESRQQCADLSAQLLAAKEAATGDGVRKVASPGGLASPPASDISTLTSERDSYKATALKLEMDIKRLSARAAEATQLEKAVATLKEKLHASEELKTAYEALQKEAQTLRDQMSARQSPPVSPEGPEAQDKQTDSTAMAQEREGLRKEVAALQEELTKLRGEAESLQTQGKGPKKPSVKGPDDTSSEETTLTATEVAELVKERQALQEKVRALEEELAALRASARSPTKALPASKSIPSLTSAPQASQPSPSKKPPAPASKLGKTAAVLSTTDHPETLPGDDGARMGKTAAVLSTTDHPETLPGDDGARSASTVTAEPAVAEAKRRPLPPKVAKAVAETPPAGAVVPAADAGAKASLSMKGGPPVNKKLPASLQPKAVKAPSPEGPGSFAKLHLLCQLPLHRPESQ
ncbi:hypothetical protein EPH_0000570 [Eimeria praecox]|uniref:Uncharacterized protein n=1 Tax=Eimeria praecox TaxID=51316 RepID=U6G0Y9_9EIME|nr:hypothetical protein EPH_0000570 [Eimeria praecox]